MQDSQDQAQERIKLVLRSQVGLYRFLLPFCLLLTQNNTFSTPVIRLTIRPLAEEKLLRTMRGKCRHV